MTDNDIDAMYKTRYFEVAELLDETLGTEEEDRSGDGIVQDVHLLAQQRNEARAALAERDTQLTQFRAQAATHANQIGALVAENARLRQQRDGLVADLTDAGNEVDLLTAETTRLRPVVDAAKTWRFSGDTAGDHRRAIAALNSAVDALPKAEATR